MVNNKKKNSHELYKANNASEFLLMFEAYAGKNLGVCLQGLLAEDSVYDVILGGSLSSGTGTAASDVDLIVLIKDDYDAKQSQKDHGLLSFCSKSDPLILVEHIAFVNGLELNIELVYLSSILAIKHGIEQGNISLSKKDIQILGRVNKGWPLGKLISVFTPYVSPFDTQDNSLDIYCASRYFVFCLKDLEDAKAAVADNLSLSIHLARLAVEKAFLSFYAFEGMVYLGSKWMRFVKKRIRQEAYSSQVKTTLEQGLYLMFPEYSGNEAVVKDYIASVEQFTCALKALICEDIEFRIAFAGTKQIM